MIEVIKPTFEVKDFISYYDDDQSVKNQHIFIIKMDMYVEFKFALDDDQSIVIPWIRVLKLKIKRRDEADE